jgi:hypothetical protein
MPITDAPARPYAEGLDTPCVIVDLALLERNIARMAALAREAGVALRPHRAEWCQSAAAAVTSIGLLAAAFSYGIKMWGPVVVGKSYSPLRLVPRSLRRRMEDRCVVALKSHVVVVCQSSGAINVAITARMPGSRATMAPEPAPPPVFTTTAARWKRGFGSKSRQKQRSPRPSGACRTPNRRG